MEVVRFERNEAIGQIVLANPPENLLNIRFSECLQQAVHEAGNSDIHVLLIRAEGPNFSQGGDILDFVDRDAHSFRSFVGEIHRSYRAIEALPIPTICAVRGAAYGGGFELVLACDLVVAAEDAVFFCLEASVGSAPLAGAVQRLAARAGVALAARYALLSEKFSGEVARQIGIVSHCVREADVESTARALAENLSRGPTRSYAAIRALLKAWSGGGIPAADALQLDLTMALHSTEDARRGRTARAEALRKGIEPSPPIFEGR
jgi:enoyl-CoA hydratase/carnithine racemase